MEPVVKLDDLGNGVAQITMQDKTSKNTFSGALIAGIVESFEEIKNNQNFKVVLLTGYDNYFCCGGTKDELLDIHRGEIGFNDSPFFRLPMECEIPVISAMQGHAIGGGLVFGLYADISILGRENIYTANFMRYGFTPGMGGTMLIPLKFGETLGTEMLYTGVNFRGGELKERGIQLKVLNKSDVMSEAQRIAGTMAEMPRVSLVTLKKYLTEPVRKKLDEAILAELEMHKSTFHSIEVRDRIESLFGK